MGKTIGIDLGTTNSVVAFMDATVRVIATGPNNEDLCRSCVAIDKSGSFIFRRIHHEVLKSILIAVVLVKHLLRDTFLYPNI